MPKIIRCGSYYELHDAQYCDVLCVAKVEHSEKENTKELLKQEMKFLDNLTHPCVVELLRILTPESPKLLMEKMGMNLTESLANKHFHHDKTAILQDVANGLSYIHGKDIIHCNLTGNSILLTEKGRAKLSDFGRAVFCQPKGAIISPVTVNNLDYMPPEILQSIPTYSTKVDVFSFGCVIIHTVTQEPPVPDHDKLVKTSEARKYVMYSEVDRRSVIIQKLRNITNAMQLYNLVLECLQDNPHDRPTAAVLHSSLQNEVTKQLNVFSRHGMFNIVAMCC